MARKATSPATPPESLLPPESRVRLRACRHGAMAYLYRDAYVGRALDLYGEYGEKELRMLLQLLRPGDTVIEAGANLGSLTVPLARHVGSGGRIIAFEPQRALFQLLCANAALNALDWVDARQAAVGDRTGTIEVPRLDYGRHNNFGGISLDRAGSAQPARAGEPVPLTTIDALELDRVDLIKIDVEGMEGAVLDGAAETIRRCRPFLYMEADRRERNPGLIGRAFELGYRLWWHCPRLFNRDNNDGRQENVFNTLQSTNLLGVPRESSKGVRSLLEVLSPDDPKPNERVRSAKQE